MKKYLYIIIIAWISLFNLDQNTYAAWDCEVLDWYEKYECQIETHCVKYEPKDITFSADEYKENILVSWEDENIYKQARKTYRDNQNGIYSCSIIKIQQNTFQLIKDKLLKVDKSGTLSSTIKQKIQLKMTKLQTLSKQKSCQITDNETIYSKKDLLIESSYQLCKYSFYLEYTKQHYSNIANSLEINESEVEGQSYGISYVAQRQNTLQAEIESERLHSHKIFNLAFQSYIDYENNLPVHLLLELIKQDFIVYRQKLYQTISPVNQVVYKIANAMSIH